MSYNFCDWLNEQLCENTQSHLKNQNILSEFFVLFDPKILLSGLCIMRCAAYQFGDPFPRTTSMFFDLFWLEMDK